jgi:hypothetical protein
LAYGAQTIMLATLVSAAIALALAANALFLRTLHARLPPRTKRE